MRTLSVLSLILTFAATSSQFVRAQIIAPAFHSYDMNSGIAHVSVSDIAEDKYGFLWLASQSGVDKFDGYTFRNFGLWGEDKTTGLQTLFVLQVEASTDGQYLWVGTYSGLSRMDVDTEEFKHYILPSSKPYNKQVINRIKTTHNGQLWIVSERNIYTYSAKSDSMELVTYLPSTTSTLTDIELIGNTLYVASTSGLYKLDPFKKKLELVAFEKTNLTRLVAAEKSQLWLGTTTNGLCLFNPDVQSTSIAKSCTSEIDGLSDNYVTDILVKSSNSIWVSTERGLNILASHTPSSVLRAPISDKDTANERISSLYQTKTGLVVVGTKDDGFAISNPLLSNFYSQEVGEGRIITSLSYYKDNKVWVANEKGLWLYDTITKTHEGPFTSHDAISNNEDTDYKLLSVLYHQMSDALWVTTRTGLATLNPQTKNLEIVALDGKSGYSINIDNDGDIWYGGYSDGLFVYRPSENRVIK